MIDLSKLGLETTNYSDFEELCNEIYRFVANGTSINRFKLSMEFPSASHPLFELALESLLEDGSLLNGSRGYDIGKPPEFEEITDSCDQTESPDDEPSIEPDSETGANDYLSRIDLIRDIDEKLHTILSSEGFYSPSDYVERAIDLMPRSTQKTILDEFFLKMSNQRDLLKTYRGQVDRAIEKFNEKCPVDNIDGELYDIYNIPSNVFLYLLNRSEAYYRLTQVQLDPGFGDVTEWLFPEVKSELLISNRNPHSEEPLNVQERALDCIARFELDDEGEMESLAIAILALLNNVSHRKARIEEVYELVYSKLDKHGHNTLDWSTISSLVLTVDDRVKYLNYDMIEVATSIIQNDSGPNYGMTVEKLFKNNEDAFIDCYIDSWYELEDFIRKFTTLTIAQGRVLREVSMVEALRNYIQDNQIYDHKRIIKNYCRRCGGNQKNIEKILESIDMDDFMNESPLTEEEREEISSRLERYQWISKDNAKSIFTDLHNLEDKFTELNMHELGFANVQDAYYRRKYATFSECILNNDFVGDEVYVDDRAFKIKMECKIFALEVENLQRYLHWIPVSKYRYINLDSSRYEDFATVLRAYRLKIIELCKQQFITPFLLKNTIIGIPDIDEDDYDLEFYDAMLISSKANHQTLAGQRFYFIPTDATNFNPYAPEFIRFIVCENEGVASITEIQYILETTYGIRVDLPLIRSQVKLSTCIFSTVTDSAYLDDQTFMEMVKHESD